MNLVTGVIVNIVLAGTSRNREMLLNSSSIVEIPDILPPHLDLVEVDLVKISSWSSVEPRMKTVESIIALVTSVVIGSHSDKDLYKNLRQEPAGINCTCWEEVKQGNNTQTSGKADIL